MEIHLLIPVAGLLMLIIIRCSIKTGCYCRFGETVKPFFWEPGKVLKPKDYEKWAGLIKDLTEHLTERYGAEEVKSWYFEVWNEPNLSPGFWTGTQEDYFKLYKYSAQAIKTALSIHCQKIITRCRICHEKHYLKMPLLRHGNVRICKIKHFI
jgi:hypothetical protein